MNSQAYWFERAKRDMDIADINTYDVLARTLDYYHEYEKRVQGEMEKFYLKYAKQGDGDVLTQDEYFAKLTFKENAEMAKGLADYARLVKQGSHGAGTQADMLRTRIIATRMDALKANITKEVISLGKDQEHTLGEGLKDQYVTGKAIKDFDMAKDLGVKLDFEMPNRQAVEKAVMSSWAGANFSERIWGDKIKLAVKLEQIIPQAILQGKSINEISKDIKRAFAVSNKDAERLARTEMNKVLGDSTFDSYKDTEVEKYQFLATLDNRTSAVCSDLDNKVFKVEDAVVGLNRNPMHPNCRSTTVPYFDENEWDLEMMPQDRIAKDANGKNITVPADMTFNEWASKYGNDEVKKRVDNVFKKVGMGLVAMDVPKTAEPKEVPKQRTDYDYVSDYLQAGFQDYPEVFKDIKVQLEKGDPEMVRLLLSTMDDGLDMVLEANAGSHYKPSTNTVHLEDFLNLYDGKRLDGYVLWHELGHAIDARYSSGFGMATKTSEEFGKKFFTSIKTDVQKIMDGAKEGGPAMASTGYLNIQLAKMYGKDKEHYSGISDMMYGLTKGKLHMGYGHDIDYYRNGSVFTTEMFADLFAQKFIDKAGYEKIRILMPNTVTDFEELLKEMIESGK